MKPLTLTIFVFAVLFLAFLTPHQDTDFGWHYRCGEQILKRGKLCDVNEFTTLLRGYRWSSPAHGYQILTYLTYRVGGLRGLSLLYAFLAAAVFTLFIRVTRGDPVFYLIGFVLLTWFSAGVLGAGFRSQVLSVLFFSLFLSLVELGERKPFWLFSLIPLMSIWANSHPGFFLGNLLLAFLALKSLAAYRRREIGVNRLLKTLSVLTLANLATLTNPYGLAVFREVFRHTQVPLATLIAEWVPPLPWQTAVVILATLAILAASVAFRALDPLRLSALILMVIFSLQARRNLPLFSLAALYALTHPRLAEPIAKVFRKLAAPELLAAFFLLTLLTALLGNGRQALSFNEEKYCQKALAVLPCRATDFLRQKPPGHVFNAYEWGGYLIWKLPDFKIFVDGRMPSWDTRREEKLPPDWRGRSPYSIYLGILQNKPGWREVLAAYETDYLLIQTGTFTDLLLREDPAKYGFEEIYRDPIAVIYTQRQPDHD